MVSKTLRFLWKAICSVVDILDLLNLIFAATSIASGGGAMIGWANSIQKEVIYLLIFISAVFFVITVIKLFTNYYKWKKLSELRVQCFDIIVILQNMADKFMELADKQVKNHKDDYDLLIKALGCFGSVVLENNSYEKDIKKLSNNKVFYEKTVKKYLEQMSVCFDSTGIGLKPTLNDESYVHLKGQLLETGKLVIDEKLDNLIMSYRDYAYGLGNLTIFMKLFTLMCSSGDSNELENMGMMLPPNIEKSLRKEMVLVKKRIHKFWKSG